MSNRGTEPNGQGGQQPKTNHMSHEITTGLASAGQLRRQMDELDESYKKKREHLNEQLSASVKELAILANSQASRAGIIRDLYWSKDVSGNILADVFKMPVARIIKIAGPLTRETNCVSGCGNKIKTRYTSRTDLKSRRPDALCYQCKELHSQADVQRNREREKQLNNMTWFDYIDTPEWISLRNLALRCSSFACQVCEADHTTLHVFLSRDAPARPQAIYSFTAQSYVLCGTCILRCEDLIDPGRREIIKKEFLESIRCSF